MNECLLDTSVQGEFKRRQKKAEFVVNLGLISNMVLAAGKLVAGIFGHSQALLADGVNSVSDVVYFLVVKFFVKLSGKPADSEHPYGHYQYETIAALVVGAFVITTGVAIFWESINAVFDLMSGQTNAVGVKSFALWAAVITVIFKTILSIQARSIGKATNNMAVVAVARDHRNDIFASTGAAVGIIFSMVGFGWADPVAGAIVAMVVAKTGFGILREAADDLMDNVPTEELATQIRAILTQQQKIVTIEEVHAHRFGPYLVANITIGIDGETTVRESDAIASRVEKELVNSIDMLRKVYIHCHPAVLQKE